LQVDADQDGRGDGDKPGDLGCDNCKLKANFDQSDIDKDGIGDVCDNCLTISNPEQTDANLNGIGDACEGLDQGSGLTSIFAVPQTFNRFVGDKRYELSNHLGNVLSVVSDRKLFQNTLSFTTFAPDVLSYSDYYPFGMLVPNRHKAGDDYRYGFQGQEKDDEIRGGEGNSLNYTFRMHDPRVGRFFARDPLANKYPWYTPYSFSGNKPIQFVELEGLEEGELKVHSETSKLATLTWNKVYTIVTQGDVAIHSANLIDTKAITQTFNSGDNIIYVKILPGSMDKNGKMKKVNLSSEKQWLKGKAWKLTISYNITSTGQSSPKTIEDANSAIFQNPALYGVIMDESAPGGQKLTFPTVAAANVNQTDDIVYTNDEVFGKNPQSIDQSIYGVNSNELLAHEIAHNFGLHHAEGDYTQQGLMSDKGSIIPPTKENNVEIINDNVQNIKIVP
jgi:RHS repeat-associated protein